MAPLHLLKQAPWQNAGAGGGCPGSDMLIPGYIVIRPDLPECNDGFGFRRFETEYVIDVAAKSIPAANAADAIVRSGI